MKIRKLMLATGLLLIGQMSLAAVITEDRSTASDDNYHHHDRPNIQVFVDTPDRFCQERHLTEHSTLDPFAYSMKKYRGLHWFPAHFGEPLFHNAVNGGYKSSPYSELYVCRGYYKGGVHPGKLYQGRCNIGWGGDEIVLNRYEVLVSRLPFHWVTASHGNVPRSAIQTGYQQDGPLYTCRVWYNDGLHLGKVVNGNCNIGWGGKEITIPVYEVLAR